MCSNYNLKSETFLSNGLSHELNKCSFLRHNLPPLPLYVLFRRLWREKYRLSNGKAFDYLSMGGIRRSLHHDILLIIPRNYWIHNRITASTIRAHIRTSVPYVTLLVVCRVLAIRNKEVIIKKKVFTWSGYMRSAIHEKTYADPQSL